MLGSTPVCKVSNSLSWSLVLHFISLGRTLPAAHYLRKMADEKTKLLADNSQMTNTSAANRPPPYSATANYGGTDGVIQPVGKTRT